MYLEFGHFAIFVIARPQSGRGDLLNNPFKLHVILWIASPTSQARNDSINENGQTRVYIIRKLRKTLTSGNWKLHHHTENICRGSSVRPSSDPAKRGVAGAMSIVTSARCPAANLGMAVFSVLRIASQA